MFVSRARLCGRLGPHCWPHLPFQSELLATCFMGPPAPVTHQPLGPALLQWPQPAATYELKGILYPFSAF